MWRETKQKILAQQSLKSNKNVLSGLLILLLTWEKHLANDSYRLTLLVLQDMKSFWTLFVFVVFFSSPNSTTLHPSPFKKQMARPADRTVRPGSTERGGACSYISGIAELSIWESRLVWTSSWFVICLKTCFFFTWVYFSEADLQHAERGRAGRRCHHS